jgi:hypothetical protein
VKMVFDILSQEKKKKKKNIDQEKKPTIEPF